jgi:SAM-dependent methyltransferase
MLRAEAAWLAARLEEIDAGDLSPLLSIGSGDAELRERLQPWIDRVVYEPLARRGVEVMHHDLERAPGVGLAGDLTDPRFLERLGELGVRSIMCCNVLEHVPDPEPVATAIERALAPRSFALVSVPRRYPYHPGPIDTMFRPSAGELRGLFPALTEVSSAEIPCESLVGYLLAAPNKRASIAQGLRVRGGHAADGGGRRPHIPLRETIRMAVGSTAVSAVVLRAP